ncbi:MAG: hypothetical protein UX72_C0003G0062 [Parcubacteria group bacterium GW2011_GWA2_47_10]|nr:MAG: hypothetical protein UX72_C0003G0062 [Parcubacteria group bacterium GW2011_GWA2_47_10]
MLFSGSDCIIKITMAENLTEKKCVSCEAGTPPFGAEKIAEYSKQLKTKWDSKEGKKLRQEFEFKDFKEAVAFINKIAGVAESEGHHPDIFVFYNKVAIELWTHASGGLTENDFIVAAKIEALTLPAV